MEISPVVCFASTVTQVDKGGHPWFAHVQAAVEDRKQPGVQEVEMARPPNPVAPRQRQRNGHVGFNHLIIYIYIYIENGHV